MIASTTRDAIRVSAGYDDETNDQLSTLKCGRYLLESIEVSDRDARPSVTEIFEQCVGCKWTLHVISQIRDGVRRPGELERTADGLTTKVLNERLVKLVRFGILNKTSFPEVPPRVEYRLTEFGKRFVEILDQVEQLQLDCSGPAGTEQ